MDKELYPKKLIVVKKICRVDLFIKKIEKICRCRAEYLESKHVIANWSYIQDTATLDQLISCFTQASTSFS